MAKDISKLEKNLGITFKNKDFLLQSVVHRSYINEHPEFKLGHNERLEFLGDAVLELAVTEYLYKSYPNPEGELTNWRASLVNSKMLAELAREFDIEQFLMMSKGEAKDKSGKARQYILANAFEALIGAIYLDQGIRKTETFIKKNLLSKLPYILEHKLYLDAKSKFQEMAQEREGYTPSYKVISETGPDHARRFKIGAYLGGDLVATGSGTSKQEAQMRAAENALEKKGW